MKKKLLGIVIGILALSFLYITIVFASYFHRQNENKKMVEYCSQNNTKECYTRMFELLLPKILIYKAKKDNNNLTFAKMDRMDTLCQPFLSLRNTDVFIEYTNTDIDNSAHPYKFLMSRKYGSKIYEFQNIASGGGLIYSI